MDAQGALTTSDSVTTVLVDDASVSTTVSCASGSAAIGMQIYGINNDLAAPGGYIGALNLICSPFPSGGTTQTVVGTDTSSGSGSNPGTSTCVTGSFMSGVNGRWGDGLDAVQIACTYYSLTSSPSSRPTTRPTSVPSVLPSVMPSTYPTPWPSSIGTTLPLTAVGARGTVAHQPFISPLCVDI